MINPQTFFEQLMFNTIRIETRGQSDSSVGTGFCFQFKKGVDSSRVLVTNKHVIEDAQEFFFLLHIREYERPSSENIKLNVPKDFIRIVEHPILDLCCIDLDLIVEYCKKSGKEPYLIYFIEDNIMSDGQLEELDLLQEVYMIGYPIGLFDEKHNLPILRRGVTASHPMLDFNGKQEGLIDCACFPGSSGSPIVVYQQNYMDKKGNTMLGSIRFGLLGILYAGPQISVKGEVTIEKISTKSVATSNIPINLGYYIKSSALFDLKNMLLQNK